MKNAAALGGGLVAVIDGHAVGAERLGQRGRSGRRGRAGTADLGLDLSEMFTSALICVTASPGMPQPLASFSVNLAHFSAATASEVITLQNSSRWAWRSLAALAAAPRFSTSVRSLVNSVKQGGAPPPLPPMGDMPGAPIIGVWARPRRLAAAPASAACCEACAGDDGHAACPCGCCWPGHAACCCCCGCCAGHGACAAAALAHSTIPTGKSGPIPFALLRLIPTSGEPERHVWAGYGRSNFGESEADYGPPQFESARPTGVANAGGTLEPCHPLQDADLAGKPRWPVPHRL